MPESAPSLRHGCSVSLSGAILVGRLVELAFVDLPAAEPAQHRTEQQTAEQSRAAREPSRPEGCGRSDVRRLVLVIYGDRGLAA